MNYEKLKSAARKYATSPTGDIDQEKLLSFIDGAEWADKQQSKYQSDIESAFNPVDGKSRNSAVVASDLRK